MIHDFRHKPAHFAMMNHDFRHKLLFLCTMNLVFEDKPISFFHNGNKMLILPLTY